VGGPVEAELALELADQVGIEPAGAAVRAAPVAARRRARHLRGRRLPGGRAAHSGGGLGGLSL